MAALPPAVRPLRIYEDEGRWVAVISDTNIRYYFVGEDVAEGLENVRRLANLMHEGQFEVLPELVNIFQDVINPAMVYTQMFKHTDGLTFLEHEYFVPAEDGWLFDFMEEAGEFLLELLA